MNVNQSVHDLELSLMTRRGKIQQHVAATVAQLCCYKKIMRNCECVPEWTF